MGNKLFILADTTKQLLLLTEILNKYELQDLKWQILLSIPETNDAITTWLFVSEYLEQIPQITKSKYIAHLSSNNIVYDEVIIERFENLFEFKNNIEFMNFFDICMYSYILYFDIIHDISLNFDFYPPNNGVFLNFSDIINKIIKDGDNYKILHNVITIPIMVDIHDTDIIIKIQPCDKLSNKFIGLFTKIKEYVLKHYDYNRKLALNFIIEGLIKGRKPCDCFDINFNMK